MPICNTRYFGATPYEPDSLIRMARGPFGFGHEDQFVLIQVPGHFPLVYMQSVLTPDLCFLGLPVLTVDHDYRLRLSPEDAACIEVPAAPVLGTDALCLTLITTGREGPTANLLAPVVLNLRTRRAAQCINAAEGYPVRHPLCAVEEGVAAC
jgi:flagellar assembly factor FliW